jgi:hypothetical protein
MAEMAMHGGGRATSVKPTLDGGLNPLTTIIFLGVLAANPLFTVYSLYADTTRGSTQVTTWVPFLLLGVALFVVLGFEFVNGFRDTAKAAMNSPACGCHGSTAQSSGTPYSCHRNSRKTQPASWPPSASRRRGPSSNQDLKAADSRTVWCP